MLTMVMLNDDNTKHWEVWLLLHLALCQNFIITDSTELYKTHYLYIMLTIYEAQGQVKQRKVSDTNLRVMESAYR